MIRSASLFYNSKVKVYTYTFVAHSNDNCIEYHSMCCCCCC